MPRRNVLAGALLATALLLPAGAGASKAAPARSVATLGEIEAISMDGRLVAYDVGARENVHANCNKVVVWNVRTGAKRTVSGKHTCEADDSSTGAGVAELAVAGKRVAWIVNQGGNTESTDDLYTSSWSHPKERHLASAERFGDVDGALQGNWIGGLVGSGRLLAVNRWSTDAQGGVTQGKLQRVRRGLSKIASGLGTLVAGSAESGRIAVIRQGGDVAVYSSTDGSVVSTVSPGALRDVALTKTRLLVLTQANKVQVYGVKSGKLLHSRHVKGKWSKPGRRGSEARLDAYKSVAVYSSRNKIYALNISTGKNVLLKKAPKTLEPLSNPQPRLEIEKPGLVYAYDTFNHKSLTVHGHVAFVRMAKVRAAVG
jgi:hypothetical protein